MTAIQVSVCFSEQGNKLSLTLYPVRITGEHAFLSGYSGKGKVLRIKFRMVLQEMIHNLPVFIRIEGAC